MKVKNQHSTISFEDMTKHVDVSTSLIKNFIISEKGILHPNFTFGHPYAVEGAAFLICITGHGRAKVNLKEYAVEKNTIATIIPGSVIEVIEHSDDMFMECLFFSPDFLAELKYPIITDFPSKVEEYPILKINDEKMRNLLDYHSFIVSQYKKEDHPFREEIAKIQLASLLLEIAAIYIELSQETHAATTSNRQEELVNQFVRLAVKHHREERSLNFYADKMFLTPKHLSQVIKETSGKTALYWITEMTILSIKALLKSSTMTVLEISEEMNFPNSSFFGRFFKKHTGLTPVQYRES